MAFLPAGGDTTTNVTVTITPTSREFTKLGSFGNVYSFAQNLVGSMDRSQLLRAPASVRERAGPIQVAKLLDARDGGDRYVVEYTVAKEGEAARHLLSAVALAPTARYNRLVTVTAQAMDGDWATVGPMLARVVDSFAPIVA